MPRRSMNSVSVTVGLTMTVDPTEWLSGGFSVQESWRTGNSYTCSGGADSTVCVW